MFTTIDNYSALSISMEHNHTERHAVDHPMGCDFTVFYCPGGNPLDEYSNKTPMPPKTTIATAVITNSRARESSLHRKEKVDLKPIVPATVTYPALAYPQAAEASFRATACPGAALIPLLPAARVSGQH